LLSKTEDECINIHSIVLSTKLLGKGFGLLSAHFKGERYRSFVLGGTVGLSTFSHRKLERSRPTSHFTIYYTNLCGLTSQTATFETTFGDIPGIVR
jgi:hypothetical protein